MKKSTHIYYLILIAAITATGCKQPEKQDHMKTEEQAPLFPKGNKTPAEWFTGHAYLHTILQKNKNNNYIIGSVTFEPGARTNWHTHPKGQVLIVTEGKGLYQEKGKTARVIKKGDVVDIPENTPHWHGATANTKMVHIAITNYLGEENANWLNPVSDEEYNEANNH